MAKRKLNPAKEFLKKIKNTVDAGKLETNKEEVWFTSWDCECLKKDCFKRKDGLWEKRDKINTHGKDGGQRRIFIWRIAPNYCCAGQPCYISYDRLKFYNKSETEKILVKTDKYEFVWKWYDFSYDYPNRTIWGLRMGKTYFEIRNRQTKEVYVRTRVKKHFIEAYTEIETGRFFENDGD